MLKFTDHVGDQSGRAFVVYEIDVAGWLGAVQVSDGQPGAVGASKHAGGHQGDAEGCPDQGQGHDPLFISELLEREPLCAGFPMVGRQDQL